MTASLAVHGAPASQSQRSALAFAAAWLAAGHRILRVFFYHEGVLIGGADGGRAADEWRLLSETHAIELTICVGAAETRGLQHTPGTGQRIRPPFQIVGLGQLVDAVVQSDRFVTFAA